jgi:hypothetical protein
LISYCCVVRDPAVVFDDARRRYVVRFAGNQHLFLAHGAKVNRFSSRPCGELRRTPAPQVGNSSLFESVPLRIADAYGALDLAKTGPIACAYWARREWVTRFCSHLVR